MDLRRSCRRCCSDCQSSSSARSYLSFWSIWVLFLPVPSLQGSGSDAGRLLSVLKSSSSTLLMLCYVIFLLPFRLYLWWSSVGRSIYGSLECGGVNVAIRLVVWANECEEVSCFRGAPNHRLKYYVGDGIWCFRWIFSVARFHWQNYYSSQAARLYKVISNACMRVCKYHCTYLLTRWLIKLRLLEWLSEFFEVRPGHMEAFKTGTVTKRLT